MRPEKIQSIETELEDDVSVEKLDNMNQIQKAAGHRFYIKFDFKSGLYHIGLIERARQLWAFVVPSGHYDYLVIPFGLKNAPATFQRVVDEAVLPIRAITSSLIDNGLTSLPGKNVLVTLSPSHLESWKKTRDALIQTPLLKRFNSVLPYILDVGTSQNHTGRVLLQPSNDINITISQPSLETLNLRPVAFTSHRLTPSQQR
ncbi:hypothetical protein OnM2_052083 [Erysiphe neolycopersici]|uniref:Reverse transcriptase domain-containing protein n=1 Tax=Erysiphe neolycopersici TaxID=212602 RepID=A0A420HS87_9PEZI|nr:hypothetical protein OnM2_052083 [Erysiphe neolycopersici]